MNPAHRTADLAPHWRRVLVVARWREDVSWLSGLPVGWRVRVVQKDADLPNCGREASSYLWWIATHRVVWDATYAFVQGDPWPHGFSWAQLRGVDRYTPLGAYQLAEDGSGQPNHPDLQTGAAYRALDLGEPPVSFAYWAGAQFLVPGRALQRRPKRWYHDLWQEIGRNGAGGVLNAWTMERLWGHLLG
jgi:hypothetical protein